MNSGLHHVHKRKVSYLRPSENTPVKKALDNIAYPIAFLGPLSSIDQVVRIWTEKNADGVSVLFWVIALFVSSFWLIYGSVHKEKVLILAHTLWLILSATILFEIVLFL